MLLFWLHEVLFSLLGTHSDKAIHTDGTKSAIVTGAVNESFRDQKHIDSRVSIGNQSCAEGIAADQPSRFSNKRVGSWFGRKAI